MIEAREFLARLVARRMTFVAGTPCSYLRPFINRVIDDPELEYRDAANEGDAVALAAGAAVGGRSGLAIFQNAGLGNAVNALSSLCFPFRIPVMLIVTHRGQPGGPADEPQHELMGRITTDLLDVLGIPWEPFPRSPEHIEPALENAAAWMRDRELPYALLMAKDSVQEYALKTKTASCPARWDIRQEANPRPDAAGLPLRHEILSAYLNRRRAEDVVICTTGYTGRELYALGDAPNQLYMVGSMGSASSFSLGLALAQPRRRLVVFDGDGAVLMRLGNLALIGSNRPKNLVHIVLDNASYESTGKQATLSPHVCLTGIARSCGYSRAVLCESVADFDRLMAEPGPGPVFAHVRLKTGSLPDLGRPKIKPFEVRERLMKHLGVA